MEYGNPNRSEGIGRSFAAPERSNKLDLLFLVTILLVVQLHLYSNDYLFQRFIEFSAKAFFSTRTSFKISETSMKWMKKNGWRLRNVLQLI